MDGATAQIAFLVLAKALSRAAQRSDGAIPRWLEQ